VLQNFCGKPYVAELRDVVSLEKVDERTWQSVEPSRGASRYRLCANNAEHNACNWAIPDDDPSEFCESCRLNRLIPDLTRPGHLLAWRRLEAAKRRLVYALLALGLRLPSKADDEERGVVFDFLADSEKPGGVIVHTGHDEGVITINIAEADDVEREKRRVSLNEPFRTLLGHFRHEIGHYYWDRLIHQSDRLDEFRRLFGNEEQDYQKSLEKHYKDGAPSDWQDAFVSSYATMHPWEDWAESWAHYLHMIDALEMANSCGLTLRPRRSGEPALQPIAGILDGPPADFDRMIANWHSFTYVLNNLNRGLGQPHGYPFVLPGPAIEKLRFVHETIRMATWTYAPEAESWVAVAGPA
jgi:hypothetical protein